MAPCNFSHFLLASSLAVHPSLGVFPELSLVGSLAPCAESQAASAQASGTLQCCACLTPECGRDVPPRHSPAKLHHKPQGQKFIEAAHAIVRHSVFNFLCLRCTNSFELVGSVEDKMPWLGLGDPDFNLILLSSPCSITHAQLSHPPYASCHVPVPLLWICACEPVAPSSDRPCLTPYTGTTWHPHHRMLEQRMESLTTQVTAVLLLP